MPRDAGHRGQRVLSRLSDREREHAVGLHAPPRRIPPRCWLDTDGPVIGDDPAWVVRDFPHVAIGVGEGSAHAAPRGACRRPYDLPAGLLGLGTSYPQTTTVSWKRVDQDLPNWSSSNRATVSGALRCGKCPTPSSNYPSIGVKVMLEPSRFRRRVTEVGASLDHQRRHAQWSIASRRTQRSSYRGSTGSAASQRER